MVAMVSTPYRNSSSATSLGVGPAVTYQLTPAITASGGVGYRNTQRDTGNGMESVEQVSPFGQISLINDIFVASASANSFTTMSGTDNSSAYWNASLNSAWDIPFWPTVQFNYGENFSGVDKKALFDDSNGKNQNTTVSVDWDLLLANLYYEYNINEVVDGDGDRLSQSHHSLWPVRNGRSVLARPHWCQPDPAVPRDHHGIRCRRVGTGA